MATVKVILDQRENSKDIHGKYPLVLRLGHKSQTRDIPFNIHLNLDQFDESTFDISGIRNAVRKTKMIKKTFSDIDIWFDDNKAEIKLWTIAELKKTIEFRFFKKQSELSVLNHAAKYLFRFYQAKKFSTVAAYEDGVKTLVKYRMKLSGVNDKVIIKTLFEKTNNGFTIKDDYLPHDMPIKAFTTDFAKGFKAYCQGRGLAKNSINIHLRSLQAILNDAASSFKELKDHKPFDGFKTGSSSNEPIVLSFEDIQKLREAPYPKGSPRSEACQYFLFMFNNMGMNFYDMALLRVSDFDGERISYVRQKTRDTEEGGDFFSIEQSPENLAFIKRHMKGKAPDQYLFPLLSEDIPIERIFLAKQNKVRWFNNMMKKICKQLEISHRITTYTARDTWTNIGLDLGIDLRKISTGLGHSDTKTTQKHYQKKMRQTILDQINQQIIKGPQP